MSNTAGKTQSAVNLEGTFPRQIAGKVCNVSTIKNLYSDFD